MLTEELDYSNGFVEVLERMLEIDEFHRAGISELAEIVGRNRYRESKRMNYADRTLSRNDKEAIVTPNDFEEDEYSVLSNFKVPSNFMGENEKKIQNNNKPKVKKTAPPSYSRPQFSAPRQVDTSVPRMDSKVKDAINLKAKKANPLRGYIGVGNTGFTSSFVSQQPQFAKRQTPRVPTQQRVNRDSGVNVIHQAFQF